MCAFHRELCGTLWNIHNKFIGFSGDHDGDEYPETFQITRKLWEWRKLAVVTYLTDIKAYNEKPEKREVIFAVLTGADTVEVKPPEAPILPESMV